MDILTMAVIILFFAIIALLFIYWQMSRKGKEENKEKNTIQGNVSKTTTKSSSGKSYTKL